MQNSGWVYVLLALFMALLCLTYCQTANISEPPPDDEPDIVDVPICAEDDTTGQPNQICRDWPSYGVRTCLGTDRYNYIAGDTIRMEYVVINIGSATLSFDMAGFPGARFEVDEVDWSYPTMVAPLVWDITLEPQESYVESAKWDMKDTSGTVAEDGFYHLHGYLDSCTDPDTSFPLELEFAIEQGGITPSPNSFSLDICWENESQDTLRVEYALPTDSFVDISILGSDGNVITQLINANQSAGYESVQWNATSHSAGVYAVSMDANEFYEEIWFEKD